jgi:hypothetical protein
MSTDRGYTVLRDAEAFVQRLSGDKLRKAQERLAFALVRRNSLLPWIEPRSGIGREHLPADLRPLFDAAKTKTHEQIMEIVASRSDEKITQAYGKGIELIHGEARMLAKQIVLSVTRDQAKYGDKQPTQDEIINVITAEAGPQPEQAISNQLIQHGDGAPGTTTPGKAITDSTETSPGADGERNTTNVKHGEQLKEGLYVVCATEVSPKRVDAIWADKKGGVRLARGEHTMVAGEPGLGKSQIAMAMAAAVSTGGYWPCGEGHAPLGHVIILAAEDSIEHTLIPRLIAAGADLSRIHFVQAVAMDDGKGRRMFNFQSDFAKLEKLVKTTQHVVLVIIDPVTAYMGKIDSHKNAEVRGVLAPLGELARECNVAIASVTHFTKSTGGSTKAIDRIIGSIAFIAAPRIGFTVIEDPDDKDRRLLLHVKNNISRRPLGLAFRMEQRVVGSDEKGALTGSCVAWETAPIEKTADDVLGVNGNKEATAKTERIEFLEMLLAGAPKKVSEIETEARDAGLLSENQPIGQSKPFRAAREALGIKPYQPKGQKRAGWFWALPEHQMPSDRSDAPQSHRASDGKEGI